VTTTLTWPEPGGLVTVHCVRVQLCTVAVVPPKATVVLLALTFVP